MSEPRTWTVKWQQHDDLLTLFQVLNPEHKDAPVVTGGRIIKFLGSNIVVEAE